MTEPRSIVEAVRTGYLTQRDFPESDRRLIALIQSLPLIEPAPGWEERAAARLLQEHQAMTRTVLQVADVIARRFGTHLVPMPELHGIATRHPLEDARADELIALLTEAGINGELVADADRPGRSWVRVGPLPPRRFTWLVEIDIDPVWVADGFDATNERAERWLANDLKLARGGEYAANVVSRPSDAAIAAEQGFAGVQEWRDSFARRGLRAPRPFDVNAEAFVRLPATPEGDGLINIGQEYIRLYRDMPTGDGEIERRLVVWAQPAPLTSDPTVGPWIYAGCLIGSYAFDLPVKTNAAREALERLEDKLSEALAAVRKARAIVEETST